MPSEILGKKLILQFIGFAPSNSNREGGPEKLVGGFSYSLTIVLLIIIRSFALCTEVASSSGSRHCTICTVIWYGEKKNIESRLFFRSL